MVLKIVRKSVAKIMGALAPLRWKEWNELNYWKKRKAAEGHLDNDHYEFFFTDHFGLDRDFFAGKRMIDVGCGPRGSLEWADMAAERVGLDPLADDYLELGAKNHAMRYVASGSESMPFSDEYFDVVTTFNSLDHVAELEPTITELIRILKPGGTLLLITDVNHDPTPMEPQAFGWEIVERFTPPLTLVTKQELEKKAGGVYESVREAIAYDFDDPTSRYGLVSAKFMAPGHSSPQD
jgi:2-polyprenyl-3-methyl-5-hydroxy-6-metoxy-1,4-benzoquinol methylase